MNNEKVCKYIMEKCKNYSEEKYIAEECVKEKYGQTIGGYRNGNEIKNEKEHFLEYYCHGSNKKKEPCYGRLRCPQLLLFISQVMGVDEECITKAYATLKEFEEINNLVGTDKNGNYIYKYDGKDMFKNFKEYLRISEISKILRELDNDVDVSEIEAKLNSSRKR